MRSLVRRLRPNGVPVIHTVDTVLLEHGERAPVVLDKDGLVAYWPATYLAQNRAKSTNGLLAKARTIVSLSDFFNHSTIDIADRVVCGGLLARHEIDALIEHLRLVGPATARRRLANGQDPCGHVGAVEWANRRYFAAQYLDHVLGHLIDATKNGAEAALLRKNLEVAVFRLRPDFSPPDSTPRRGLSELQHATFRKVVVPHAAANPIDADEQDTAYTYCMLLDALGSRRSEPLLLKLSDIGKLDAEHAIRLQPNSDDPDDTRRQRPSLKREPRRLVVVDDLHLMLLDYIEGPRADVGRRLAAKGDQAAYRAFVRNPYLFVSAKGKPLSISKVNSFFRRLKTVEGLPSTMSPALLRNTWNDRCHREEVATANAGKSVDGLRDDRRQRMGWSKFTRMLERYALRSLESQANKSTHDASLRFERLVANV